MATLVRVVTTIGINVADSKTGLARHPQRYPQSPATNRYDPVVREKPFFGSSRIADGFAQACVGRQRQVSSGFLIEIAARVRVEGWECSVTKNANRTCKIASIAT